MAKKKSNSARWLIWLPLAVGILVTPATLHMASVLALSGPDALSLLYPFVQIVTNMMFKLPGEIANPASQWLMYLQFPLYGLLMTWLMRSRSFLFALGVVVFLHAAAVVAVYGLARLPGMHPSF